MMMRQPEQRIMSSYVYVQIPNITLADVVYFQSGCMAKQLTTGEFHLPPGGICDISIPVVAPTRAEIELAKFRLQTGFAFIGNTDQWNLSICLFNVMFKQPCRSYQFRNMHATEGKTTETYDTSPLRGYRDPYDAEVYEVGMQVFADNLMKYNVSESSCQSCWHEAGLDG